MITSPETSTVLCSSCHVGHLCEKYATYTQWHEGQLIIVPNVPSQVCDYCGEIHFHPVVLERLHQLLQAEARPSDNGAPAQRTVHAPSA